jgi:hypothetical protein
LSLSIPKSLKRREFQDRPVLTIFFDAKKIVFASKKIVFASKKIVFASKQMFVRVR